MQADRALAVVDHLDSLCEHSVLGICRVDEMHGDWRDTVAQLDPVLHTMLDGGRGHPLEPEARRRDAVAVGDAQGRLAQRLLSVGGVGERMQLDRRDERATDRIGAEAELVEPSIAAHAEHEVQRARVDLDQVVLVAHRRDWSRAVMASSRRTIVSK